MIVDKRNDIIEKGFLHARGTFIVNAHDEIEILRGYGAGNWMNPEGFMIGAPKRELKDMFQGSPKRWDRRRTVTQVIRELCGSEYLKNFWKRWEESHLAEEDIRAMSELGLNSVRLVLNANALLDEEPGIHFNEDTFGRLDQILDWCEQYGVYAILDMHAAPGGACGCCGDSLSNNFGQLFFDDESWERAIILWEEMAGRYKDREIVAGYDLLNEPASLPEEWCAIPLLAKFYDECIARIRAIDQHHMIILEGSNFARGNQIFDHDYDPLCHNWCIELHMYDASPEVKDLYPYLTKSRELQVPLWIGECGSTPIYNAVFFDICRAYGIGYSIWCWKRALDGVEMTNSVGYHLPKDWEIIRSYCERGPKPSYEKAMHIFDEMLENMKYENCIHNKEYIRISQKQPSITLPGAGYDSFNEDGSRYEGHWPYGNYLNFRMEDKTKLVWRKANDEIPFPEFRIYPCDQKMADPLEALAFELTVGEHAAYTVYNVVRSCNLRLQYTTLQPGTLKVYQNGKLIGSSILAAEPDLDISQTHMMMTMLQPAKKVTVKIEIDEGTILIHALEFDYD